MTNVELYNETVFESFKHIDEYGNEYWFARELMIALEYSKWSNFANINRESKIGLCIKQKNSL